VPSQPGQPGCGGGGEDPHGEQEDAQEQRQGTQRQGRGLRLRYSGVVEPALILRRRRADRVR
jgi:hypothetical protein